MKINTKIMPRVKRQVVYMVGNKTFHKKSSARRAAHKRR